MHRQYKVRMQRASVEHAAAKLAEHMSSRQLLMRLHAYMPAAVPSHLRFRQVRLHGACQQQVSTLIAFLHCDLVPFNFFC
jgi:hypothetical protein